MVYAFKPFGLKLYCDRRGHDRMVVECWLPVQSIPITTKVVSSNPVHGEEYSIQHYMIKFVSDLRLVGCFLRVLWIPLPIQLTTTISDISLEHHNPNINVCLLSKVYIPHSQCDATFLSGFNTINTKHYHGVSVFVLFLPTFYKYRYKASFILKFTYIVYNCIIITIFIMDKPHR